MAIFWWWGVVVVVFSGVGQRFLVVTGGAQVSGKDNRSKIESLWKLPVGGGVVVVGSAGCIGGAAENRKTWLVAADGGEEQR